MLLAAIIVAGPPVCYVAVAEFLLWLERRRAR